jgi:hypothetical protein
MLGLGLGSGLRFGLVLNIMLSKLSQKVAGFVFFPLNGPMSVEHIRGHVWHRYAIAVNQVVVATVQLSKWWPVSTHPTVLHTKKEYGRIIFVPMKKKKRHKRCHDMKFLKGNNHYFTQTSCQNWKLFRFSIKVLKSLSKNV